MAAPRSPVPCGKQRAYGRWGLLKDRMDEAREAGVGQAPPPSLHRPREEYARSAQEAPTKKEWPIQTEPAVPLRRRWLTMRRGKAKAAPVGCATQPTGEGGAQMNIDLLRECVHLASSLSFTETAKRFYITQPVLSKHIASVEKELGLDLFIRSKNGVHLTKVGRAFIQDASHLLDGYDGMLERARHIASGKDAIINIGYLHGASSRLLPQALKRFKKGHPTIEVNYLSMEIDEIPQRLDGNDIDFAVTSDLASFDSDRFNQVELYPDSLCLIVPRGHRLSERSIIRLDDLKGEEIIVPRSSFMPNESTYINKILSPIVESIRPKRLIGDLNSIAMSMAIENCAAIEFDHLRNIFSPDQFSFIPLDANIPAFNVVAAWKRAGETEAMHDLAAELKQQCIAKGLCPAESR